MSEPTKRDELQKIDLEDLRGRFEKLLRKYWPGVILLCAVFAAVFLLRAYQTYSPRYESRAMFTVSSGYSADDIFSTSYYDNSAAQQLAEAFPYMLSTQVMQDLMKAELGVGYINGTVTANAVADSNMFSLTVRSSNPSDAQRILQAVIDVFPQVAVYIVDNPQVVIRQSPSYSETPVNRLSWKRPVAKGMALGFVLSVGILMVFAYLSRTVTDAQQLKKLANMPVLSSIPQLRRKRRRTRQEPFIMPATNPELTQIMQSLALKSRKLLDSEQNKVILVTSTLSGEGKTTVSCNLALSLAKEGYKVALVDADIRNQSVAERFGLGTDKGNLLQCLKDSRWSVLDCLQTIPGSSLAILSGESVTQRRYDLDARSMRRVMSILSGEFDYIVMDTAPCAVVADTSLLCHYAGCVLYVVRSDCAWQSQIIDSIQMLYERGVSTAGFVFNGAKLQRSSYGYGYKYGYSYKYGYGRKYGYGYEKKSR